MTEKKELKTICAWCGVHIDGDKENPRISHGCCLPCKNIITKDWKKKKSEGKDLEK